MVLYDFYCPECSEERVVKNPINQDFPPLFCEKCNVALKQKLPFLKPLTCNSGHAIADRLYQEAEKDIKDLQHGNQKKMSDLIGDKPNVLKK